MTIKHCWSTNASHKNDAWSHNYYSDCQRRPQSPPTTSLSLNTGLKLVMYVILIICEWEKYPLANVCELESSMSSKHLERIFSGLTSLLVENTLQVDWKVNFEPWNINYTRANCEIPVNHQEVSLLFFCLLAAVIVLGLYKVHCFCYLFFFPLKGIKLSM